MSFPFYKQLDNADCGPTCLRMVAKYYGYAVTLDYLRTKTKYGEEGVSMLGISEAAEAIGFKTAGAKLTLDQLKKETPLPAILHWNQSHFVVIHPGSFSSGNFYGRLFSKGTVEIADPASEMMRITEEEFINNWLTADNNGTKVGFALLLGPTPEFEKMKTTGFTENDDSFIRWKSLLEYVYFHKSYFIPIVGGLIVASILQLVFPYLTQVVVDKGINSKDLGFIQIVLVAQLMLLFSLTVIEFIRSRLLLYISTRINISLLSNFWAKLLKLPLHFFESKHPGDILQRIGDHHRIEAFLTGTALNTLISVFSLVIFSIVMISYNLTVFFIFAAGSILYIIWIRLFLKYRRQLDNRRFFLSAKESNTTMQLVYGIQEIKLNNAELTYRRAWENLQAGLFTLNFKGLSLSQYQQAGAFFINQGKNFLITYIVAKLVINNELSFGMMMAVQYILGQLNGPIEQLIGFVQQAQDAKISVERLNDIHKLKNEAENEDQLIHALPANHSLTIKDLVFCYPGSDNEAVLKELSLHIPQGKVVAIVGMSGSGKTTLVKLLLKFYDQYQGNILVGKTDLKNISPDFWRSKCGVVMQDSFIFNETIERNITVTEDPVDEARLINACKTANILSFVESLPLKFKTRIGAEGYNLSGGQRQRLSIARAVYKNPEYLLFDEATNSLDANNEKEILKNLSSFFEGRTVIVVAHRLSTVKNADKIVVMSKGEMAEEGTHEELIRSKGQYFELVKNQLELDS